MVIGPVVFEILGGGVPHTPRCYCTVKKQRLLTVKGANNSLGKRANFSKTKNTDTLYASIYWTIICTALVFAAPVLCILSNSTNISPTEMFLNQVNGKNWYRKYFQCKICNQLQIPQNALLQQFFGKSGFKQIRKTQPLMLQKTFNIYS